MVKTAILRRAGTAGCLLSLLVACPAVAGELAIPPGETLDGGATLFVLPPAVAGALAAAAVGETVAVDGFPIAPGVSARLELERYDVYAPGARIVVVDAAGEHPASRSRRRHFLGQVAGDPSTRAGLSLDPGSGHLRGVVDGPFGEFQIQASFDGGHRLESSADVLAGLGAELETGCATDRLPLPASLDGLLIRPPAEGSGGRGSGPTHFATVAVDTDMELLDEKFDNDTAEATDWLADLFTAMNVAYERDVALRLVQGDTFLRPGNPPYTGDPWNVEGSGASTAHLNELGGYWSANMGGVDRVFAMLLSGKSSSGTSSSGIAWLDGYCENQSTGGGYSYTQVFTANIPVTNDVRVVGHEIGHNAGSPHTHCYVPPIDHCYNAQGGCYAGTTSCPGGPGTLMSYCHVNGCGSNRIEFHPTVVALFDVFILSHPACIEELGDDEIFIDGFESGGTGAWS